MPSATNIVEHSDVVEAFFEELPRADARLLMLDYDGTLAPFTTDRGRAVPYPGIPDLISRIMQCRTRVVLISGRAASELLLLAGIYPHPEIWGSHGAERLYPDGSYHMQQPAAKQVEGLRVANRSLRAAGLAVNIEEKPAALAVHWRGLSLEKRTDMERKVREVARKIKDYGLDLFSFDGGLEIRSGAINKGDAVRSLLHESSTRVAAAYLGDDQTDEAAFCAIKARGLAVLVRGEPRPTAADTWLRPPNGLVELLQKWLVACGAEE